MKAAPRPFFYPKFFRLLRGYRGADFLSDLSAGLTVGIIALPLAIGFGIASGVTPGQGLWTAIIGGLLISLLGGSRHQIGGPTGAFVPVLAAVTAAHGYNGLALATMMAGVLLVLMGAFRLGALLKYIPYPVVAGFTAGIAVIIFLGQVPEFLGLMLPRTEHAPALFMEIVRHAAAANWHTAAIGVLALAIGFLWPKLTRKVPASLVAVVVATVLATWLGWSDVATIQSKFHGIPSGLPGFHFPPVSLEKIRELLAPAFTIAALGGIESLLSATVADGMADTRHDSNQELIGQGIANVLTPLIGGFAVTGAIARTAANIRSGARTPIAGIVHALVLLIFVLVAAKVAAMIPLAALSAVLIGVALRMGEWDTFAEMWRASRTDFGVLVAAFALTVLFDLTIGVGGGLLIAAVLFLRRMEGVTQVRLLTAENDTETGANAVRGKDVPPGVVLFRFEGPLFFAAAEKLEFALRAHTGKPRIIIFRMRHVPMMDATGMKALEVAWEKMHRDGVTVLVTAIQPQPMKVMFESGLADRIGMDNFCPNIDDALDRARKILGVECDGGK
ncbi:MAG: sulfate permease [Verrucomicrobia bacterium]|nr:sulfate permease [Verrucomicrobiota bacterium]